MTMPTQRESAGYATLSLQPSDEVMLQEACPSRIDTEKRWWHERKAAQSLQSPSASHRGGSRLCCQVCSIFVGPSYTEQQLYFCLLVGQEIKRLDAYQASLVKQAVLCLCGGCMKHYQKHHPDWLFYRVLGEEEWIVIQQKQLSQIAVQREVMRKKNLVTHFLRLCILLQEPPVSQYWPLVFQIFQAIFRALFALAGTPAVLSPPQLQHMATIRTTPVVEPTTPVPAPNYFQQQTSRLRSLYRLITPQ